ncbi:MULTISPECIES: AraC family transcriptional regulator [unclassified Bradyrhizobium]|uniref:AraC family transcriptional regulator n=1 Tax=unclassified Bradyrhizobium TaxID=2631580 RepID=UPI002479025C|nr:MULTISPECIES: AraC family transcriptional regulator [unclassified Bradyrhizobium]WGS17839.1 AraC family transcriptional regulator [Bradyrhizobium sp. ISRA463]WGS24638.1 AraC family transcriptional regulator [Bradyrhizobium sp. ISRA464]
MPKKEAQSLDRFEGLEQPTSLELNQIMLKDAALSRLRWQDDDRGTPVQMEQSDGYMVCYQRNHLPAPSRWVDGKAIEAEALDPGQFLLLDLRQSHSAVNRGNIDCISLFASHNAMVQLHLEHDLPSFSTLRITDGLGYFDPTIRNLMECVTPAFEKPDTVSPLFLDQLALAMMSHLTHVYGERDVSFRPVKGGLAPWQERRTKSLLLANLRGDVNLETLAKECGLSRAHFARSFKMTTGKSPMAWLVSQRLIRARELLAESPLSLSEIAYACGFADQSHFSRAFARHVGVAPGSGAVSESDETPKRPTF